MSSTTLILVAGCIVFAVTTVAALWAGYMAMQRLWLAENQNLPDHDGLIGPLLKSTHPRKPDGHDNVGRQIAESPILR